ncbi:MAG: hypothetical protein ACP5HM_11535 [Anaerolineae bacterium]
MKIKVDKIASVVTRVGLPDEVELLSYVDPQPGTVLAVQAMADKEVYNQLELTTGEMVTLERGDVIVGALGARKALQGFVGVIPAQIHVGDTLHMLNLGGVVGLAVSGHPNVGPPLALQVLGGVRPPHSLKGHGANIHQYALPGLQHLTKSAPIVMVSGTNMNSGKTTVAGKIIAALTGAGQRVAAAKLTGVGLRRDARNMEAQGAVCALTFVDAGISSTANPAEDVAAAARGIIHALNREAAPDVIVLELGDGLLGGYGVHEILSQPDIQAYVKVHVLCANDPVAAWGAKLLFRERYGREIDVISGPTTDTAIGVTFVHERLQLPAANALAGETLGALVKEKLAL